MLIVGGCYAESGKLGGDNLEESGRMLFQLLLIGASIPVLFEVSLFTVILSVSVALGCYQYTILIAK